jgi:8-oxo-dGTP pyrophosphatase MutT (NUDIX family)
MEHVDEPAIRKAASVICVRGSDAGPEVLVLRRSPQSRFLPGYVAFPGGAVDREDEAHAERWFGDPGEAHRAAAVRELVEEVGLATVVGGMVGAPAVDPFGPVDTSPPRADQLHEIAHWIAPPEVPVRFDARYFVLDSPNGLEPVPDGREADLAWWTSPAVLLSEWEAGDHKLYWPTYLTLLHVAACSRASDMLALRFETRDPTEDEVATLPTSVMEQEP